MSGGAGADDVEAVLDAIHDDLADDGIYVAPSLAGSLTPEELEAIADNVAANPIPTFVVLYPFDNGDPFAGKPQDLLTRLHAEYPVDGQYYSTDQFLQYGGDGVSLDGRSYGVPGGDGEIYNDALTVVSYERPATVGEAVERLTDLLLLPPDEVAEIAEQASTAASDSYDGDGDGSDGIGATGLTVALVVAVVVGAAGWARLRRRRPKVPAGTFALPPSAMDRIREAHDQRLEREARDELLALGEAVEATSIQPRHDSAAWQAALDHYDAARRALTLGEDPEDPEILDVVGSLVLARRGRAALARAVRGRAWAPVAGCFLNPLHGDATGTARVTSTSERQLPESVPVCGRCRSALGSGKVPDVLDVVDRGRPRHYFDTDAEPWASTGYGSLTLDLVAAVQGMRS